MDLPKAPVARLWERLSAAKSNAAAAPFEKLWDARPPTAVVKHFLIVARLFTLPATFNRHARRKQIYLQPLLRDVAGL